MQVHVHVTFRLMGNYYSIKGDSSIDNFMKIGIHISCMELL